MQKKVFQLLVDNTSGVLSRISGLFSRRGYNIESITAGVTADPRFTRITIGRLCGLKKVSTELLLVSLHHRTPQ